MILFLVSKTINIFAFYQINPPDSLKFWYDLCCKDRVRQNNLMIDFFISFEAEIQTALHPRLYEEATLFFCINHI